MNVAATIMRHRVSRTDDPRHNNNRDSTFD